MEALYTALAGMNAEQGMLTAVSDNLDNAASPGYLTRWGEVRDTVWQRVARVGGHSPQKTVDLRPAGVVFTNRWSLSASPVNPSGHSGDVAIVGNAFFAVRTASGAVAYTRNGSFTVDGSGRLVTPSGDLVLDTQSRPIVMPGPGPFTVLSDGTVRYQGQTLGRLGLYQLSPASITSQGNGNYGGTATPAPAGVSVLQNSLNGTNVSLVHAASNLIEAESRYQSLLTVLNQESTRLKTAAGLGILA